MDLSKYSIPLSELPEQTKTLDKEIKISDFKGYESSNEIIRLVWRMVYTFPRIFLILLSALPRCIM